MSSNVAKMPTSSFVTHTLATAGRLDREDLNAKLSQLSRKTAEMKVAVYDALHKNYAEFYPSFEAINTVSKRISRFQQETNDLLANIESQVKAQMLLSATENDDLFTSWSETKVILGLIGQLVKVHEWFQSISKNIIGKEFVKAATQGLKVEEALAATASSLGDSVKILPHLQARHFTLQEQLMHSLKTAWAEIFQWKLIEEDEFAAKAEKVVELSFACKMESDGGLSDLIQAMDMIGILNTKVKILGERLTKHLLLPVLTIPGVTVSRSYNNASTVIRIVTPDAATKGSSPAPLDALLILHELETTMAFLDECFSGHGKTDLVADQDTAKSEKSEISLMMLLGAQLADRFADLVITECLSRSVPTKHSGLNDYKSVVTATERLQIKLISIKFLDGQNVKLTDYVNNVDLVFANKKCQEILERARDLMKSEIHNVVSVSSGECQMADLKLNLGGEEKQKGKIAELVDSKLLPPFCFPNCKISSCAYELVEIAYQMMQEAVDSGQVDPEETKVSLKTKVSPKPAAKQCAIQMFYGVRNMFELYCSVVPVYHKEKLQTLPLMAAVHHNDCMYIAHHLSLLGHQYRPLLPEPLCYGAATFIDLVPVFRRLGAKSFMEMMAQQKVDLLDCLSVAQGFVSLGEGDNYHDADRAVHQLTLKLRHLGNVWRNVLPVNVYNKSIGALLNAAVVEILSRICLLEDISELDAKHLNSILQILSDSSHEFFQDSAATAVFKFVSKWNKMEEIKFLLTARLQEIADRWTGGKGPLAAEFTAAEIKQLIRALFQNTEKRATVLASIK